MVDFISVSEKEIEEKVKFLSSVKCNHTPHMYIDITGDLVQGTLLSRIMYWFSVDKNKKSKVRVFKDGYFWIAKQRRDWWEEIRITERQYDKAIGELKKKGFVELGKYKFNSMPTIHIRPNYDNINSATKEWESQLKEEIIAECESELQNEANGIDTKCNSQGIDAKCKTGITQESNLLTGITNKDYIRDYIHNSLSPERASESEPPKQKRQSRKKEANENFERLWKLYPKKLGKGQVSDTQKLKLLEIGYDELSRAIQRCCAYNKDKDRQYWQNGSTFFNSGYIDFLDENYEDSSSPNVASMGEVRKEPLSEKEKIRLGIEKARETFGEDYGESYWNGMDDGEIEIMLEYLGIRINEF